MWRVGDAEWQVRLSPRTRGPARNADRIYLLEHSAALVDGPHWLHEVRCWLHHAANAEVAVDFPESVRLRSVAVDGVEATPRTQIHNPKSHPWISDFGLRTTDQNKRLWLPLPGRPGVRCIRLRWLYDQPEPFDRPTMTPPHLVGALEGPILETVMVPPGWRASLVGASGWQGTTRDVARALWRADTQLRICLDLAQQRQDSVVSATLADAQRRFARTCRQARASFDVAQDVGAAAGPQGQSLARWFEDLQTKEHEFQAEWPAAVDAAESSPSNETAAEAGEEKANFEDCGTPLSWQTLPGAEPGTLQLTSRASARTRHAVAISFVWLAAVAALGALAFFPLVMVRLRLFWPEQLALLGLLGWYGSGMTWIALGLLFFAFWGRVYLLLRGLSSLLVDRRADKRQQPVG